MSLWDLEVEGGEVGFVDFAETEGVGDEAFSSFDFDVIAYGALPAIKLFVFAYVDLPAKNSSPDCRQ